MHVSIYYLKREVTISFCSVLCSDLDTLLIMWRKTKKRPEVRITEGLKGKKRPINFQFIFVFFIFILNEAEKRKARTLWP